ncbi:MAG: DNA polymerase III subunit chi [Woeseiaceae bacterium]|nr:DNA polymerase III subunit chi [Gammaproteobacteria bacterium]NND46706.1 DNA polymerase III subunit chi [Woeseiaceae bacterium]
MARVDFYVLQRADDHARLTFACRLAEKAYRLDNTVYLHTPNRSEAEHLDQLLWTFRDGSFVPHALVGDAEDTAVSPIMIGNEADGIEPRDLLINLDDSIPGFAANFPRVAEVVSSDEQCRRLSRKRFVEYRDNGHSIQTHNI